MEPEVFAIRPARFPCMQWFDGQVISGFAGVAKPDSRIFEVLLLALWARPRSGRLR
jgi:FMN phosphatase YigB (HAD superfamily)